MSSIKVSEPSVTQFTIEHALNWRYATKKFDPSRRLGSADWQTLKNSLVRAPSSYGLQPWRFLSIETPSLREQLKAVSWNQSQVTDASHLVVIAAREKLSADDVNAYVANMASERGVPIESLAGYRDMMVKNVAQGLDPAQSLHWAQRQTYIALGFLLETAALLSVDATPMEGFDPAAYDEILGLRGQGWRSTVVVALGYRHPDDSFQALKKVRRPEREVLETR